MLGFFKRPFVVGKTILLNGEGQILIIRRSKIMPIRPGHWDLPGGTVDPGESPLEAAIRETKEETGLTVSDLKLVDVLAEARRPATVAVFYQTKVSAAKVKISHEHDQFLWIDQKDIEDYNLPRIFKEAVKKLTQSVK